MPLELHGRNEENVPVFSGALEGNSTAPWLFTIFTGVLLAAVFLVGGIHALAIQRDIFRFVAALVLAGFVCGTIVFGAVWWYRITREIPYLESIGELAARLELEAESVKAIAKRRGIRPRVEVNGENLYRLRDFGNISELLRPSAGPSGDYRTMLRSSLSIDPDQLPRAAYHSSPVPTEAMPPPSTTSE